ncbi:hypothetical protein [Phaffia rhodozyma]|uniref:Uncharacterized protein n=1 Tax=Phaffia rhodozyma TaxID=264483 RepID=A0A0F7SMG4_PHARH|nr:hypothetical protein [Phaffia rhodozyma]
MLHSERAYQCREILHLAEFIHLVWLQSKIYSTLIYRMVARLPSRLDFFCPISSFSSLVSLYLLTHTQTEQLALTSTLAVFWPTDQFLVMLPNSCARYLQTGEVLTTVRSQHGQIKRRIATMNKKFALGLCSIKPNGI